MELTTRKLILILGGISLLIAALFIGGIAWLNHSHSTQTVAANHPPAAVPTDASDIVVPARTRTPVPVVADAASAVAPVAQDRDAATPAVASSEATDASSPETIGASYSESPTPPSAPPSAPPRPALNCRLGGERFPHTCSTMSIVGMVFLPPSTEMAPGWNCGPITQNLPINFHNLTADYCACQFCEAWPSPQP